MKTALECGETEHALIQKAQQGDQKAYNCLVMVYREGVLGMVLRICGDVSLAEDVAQDAFLRAWQKLHTFNLHTSFRNWLYRIAANRLLDILRRERDLSDIAQLTLAERDSSPEQQFVQNEREKAVRQAVLSLPPASRSVLVLREYENLSYQEISDILQIPAGTVMSRLNYARKKLTEILQDYLETI